jgi:hypothetical protein
MKTLRHRTHNLGRHANDSGRHKLAKNRKPELIGDRAASEHDGSRAIRDLGSVPGVRGARLREHGLQLSQRLCRDVLP